MLKHIMIALVLVAGAFGGIWFYLGKSYVLAACCLAAAGEVSLQIKKRSER